MSWRSAARASSKPAAINQHRRTLISSLSLPAATTEDQACCQAGWPADVQHRILFLEPCCFYRLTALKYGPNPFIAPLVWLLLEVEHIQASEQNPPCISPVIWRPLFLIKLWECSFFFPDSCRGTNMQLHVMTAWNLVCYSLYNHRSHRPFPRERLTSSAVTLKLWRCALIKTSY